MSEKTIGFNVVITPAQLAAIDVWRQEQSDVPGRSESVRRLLDRALTAALQPPRDLGE